MTSPAVERARRLAPQAVPCAALGAALLWSFWPALMTMVHRWSVDPRYSHGFLVPAFSLYLLWTRRDQIAGAPPASKGSIAAGLGLIVLGAALKFAGGFYFIEWVDAVSLLPSLAGLCTLAGGWRALKWAAPSIAFLVFMIPLPYRLERALGTPLQQIATVSSAYILQTLGLPAVTEGYTILMNEARIGVVEACNGLGMLYMFVAFAAGAAIILQRPWYERLALLLGAAPTALAANVARITVTGFLNETVGGHAASVVYHDLAGWLMMPMALAAIYLELALVSRLFVEVEPPPQISFIPVGTPPRPAPARPGRP